MPFHASTDDFGPDHFGSGMFRAVALHILLAIVILGLALYAPEHIQHWGENASSVGAIQASMVSAIPLPAKVAPVKNSVLASDNVTPAPKPPPKEATQPPPKPTNVLIKEKTPEKTKVAPITQPTPPKHPQPTPATPKAATGDAATQLPEAITQLKNGTAMATVQDRTFGNRYAYYLKIVSNTVAQNWYTGEADPQTSQGKHVTLLFDINRDGTPSNVRIETRSGSASLDSSALHAIERVDSFGPLPAGDHITVEYTFDYKAP
ncbi:MAG TPA: energy transducer TonB [Acidobacteriaceae bacterium]|jgi:protein TonB|nr:energy transducer TonB [Acidobacteriaceae bacterium]